MILPFDISLALFLFRKVLKHRLLLKVSMDEGQGNVSILNITNILHNAALFLAKELYNSNQNINYEVMKHINHALIEVEKVVNRNEKS